MITFTCVKSDTNKYPPFYVNRLFYAIKRNITVPFKFVCFTNQTEELNPEIETISLPYELPKPGWWQKIYMFCPNNGLSGRIFYFDLDTVIIRNIDHILEQTDEFIVLRDFFKERFPNGKYDVGSGVMSWTVGKHAKIWETFITNPQDVVKKWHPHGDQKHIQEIQTQRLYWQDLFPKIFVSYKVHCNREIPKDARVVSFHGTPSISEAIETTTKVQGYTLKPNPILKQYWKDE